MWWNIWIYFLDITTCIDATEYSQKLVSQGSCTKNVGIRIFYGRVITWCIIYCLLYPISKRLKLFLTDIICKWALLLDGNNVHQLFIISTEEILNTNQQVEIFSEVIAKTKEKFFLWFVDILIFEKQGKRHQKSLTILYHTTEDPKRNFSMGGGLIILSKYQMQIQTTGVTHFWRHVFSFLLQTVFLEKNVQASNDAIFKPIKKIIV